MSSYNFHNTVTRYGLKIFVTHGDTRLDGQHLPGPVVRRPHSRRQRSQGPKFSVKEV